MVLVIGGLLVALGLVYVVVRMRISKHEAISSLGDHDPFEDNDPRLHGVETPED